MFVRLCLWKTALLCIGVRLQKIGEKTTILQRLWPVQSPNLNPIKNVWKLLKDVMLKIRRLKNQEDMWLAIESKWKAIPESKLEASIATMPRRIKNVIVASRGSIH